jgi:adenylate cyclase
MADSHHPALHRRDVRLTEDVWREAESARLVERLVALLRESGIPLLRVNIAYSSLHPELVGFANIWQRGTDRVESLPGTRAYVLSPQVYDRSPFRLVNDGKVAGIRRRLERADWLDDLDVLDEMRAEGATDYVVMTFGSQEGGGGSFTSWTTDRPGGFSTPELVAIAEHTRLLSHVLQSLSARETARTLVNTYVGAQAGARILAGDIVRGRSSNLEAAIWLSEIRDFTVLSGRLPADALLVPLNRHFDALGKDIDRELVLSADFAARCREPTCRLGSHRLRGIPGEHAVFAPDSPSP